MTVLLLICDGGNNMQTNLKIFTSYTAEYSFAYLMNDVDGIMKLLSL